MNKYIATVERYLDKFADILEKPDNERFYSDLFIPRERMACERQDLLIGVHGVEKSPERVVLLNQLIGFWRERLVRYTRWQREGYLRARYKKIVAKERLKHFTGEMSCALVNVASREKQK